MSIQRFTRWALRPTLVMAMALASFGVVVSTASPASADGPAPCSAGNPPAPYRGFCGTFGGANTWFGSYGLGFPTPLGWGLCAFRAGGGGYYPSPTYAYVLTGPPAGGDTSSMDALGFAMSQATVSGFWDGKPGAFTADQAAVAAKLLYDQLVWHTPAPSIDPGVAAAYNQLSAWVDSARGASGPPQASIGLLGGGTTFTSSATVRSTMTFPGTGRALSGVGVLMTLTNATFDGTGGSTSAGSTTDASGTVSFSITANGPGPVTASIIARVGQMGLLFDRPTQFGLGAQDIVAAKDPTVITETANFSAAAPPPSTGSIAITKSGDDTSYFPISGARFDIMSGSTVVDSLVTGPSGAAGPSAPLLVGTYRVHEAVPPPGYAPAPDQNATVSANATTTVSFIGSAGDKIIPATATLAKVDRISGSPLAGAILGIRYDSSNSGAFTQDLGTCTTDAAGTCSPAGNDGPGLLPGTYEVREVAAPSGYAPDQGGTQILELAPGQQGTVTFSDPPLVPQRFVKSAAGNVESSSVILAGAVITVTDSHSTLVAGCVTDNSGTCITESALIAGDHYCWHEIIAPPGLALSPGGCFVASAPAGAISIDVIDPGRYVNIEALKVDAENPSHIVPGATFDLYRLGRPVINDPTPPHDARVLKGTQWVGRSTGGGDGIATFPLQLPNRIYCVIEHLAPAGYVVNPRPKCSGIVHGSTHVPATTVVITVQDPEERTSLAIAKTNASQPGVGVPDATYDLFVKGTPPPSVPAVPDPLAPLEANLTWFAAGTTDAQGHLQFSIPVGYEWCVKERSAPEGFLVDPALRCTGIVTSPVADQVTTIAEVEKVRTILINAYKFDAEAPGTGIPGASYALFVDGPMPGGFVGPPVPPSVIVPDRMNLFATGTTDNGGHLSFAIPSGNSWCMRELTAPSGYRLDPALHCTGLLTTDATSATTTLALPELPNPKPEGIRLATTGVTPPWVAGLGLVVSGAILLGATRRRRADQ